MLRPVPKLSGYTIEASDGHIGSVNDILSQLDQIYESQLHSHYGWPGYGL